VIQFSYGTVIVVITALWLLTRFLTWRKNRRFSWKRELELILVYICLIVIARYTLHPFAKLHGKIQPLVLDLTHIFPPRVNLVPLVHLWDYPEARKAWLNFIGNTTMFLPVGIIWPSVYRQLNTPGKVIAAGAGFSLAIEIFQLPFYDRVTDIDDLLMNTTGFLLGYGIWLLVRWLRKKRKG
jgi:glycopeptide antibiotics resistance protein